MITVKKLISELKKMPQNLPVGVAMHDNSIDEIAGDVNSVEETVDNYDPNNPIKYVVLRC